MSSVRNSIWVARPVEDVFAVLTDMEQSGTWFPGVPGEPSAAARTPTFGDCVTCAWSL